MKQNNRIRILHVIGSLNPGGSQSVVINLLKHIDREKIIFDFIVDTPGQFYLKEFVESLGSKVFYLPKFNGFNLIQVKKNWKVFFDNHPEYKIIHSHVRSYASIYLGIAKKRGLKTIIHSHNTSNGKGIKAIAKKILQYRLRNICDYFFCCSIDSGVWLFGKKIGLSKKLIVLKNAIDLNVVTNTNKRDEVCRNLDLNPHKIIIGIVARMEKVKNPYFILELAKTMSKVQNNFIFVWVGDGSLLDDINNEIKKRNLTDFIRCLGNRDDVRTILWAFDYFALPSFYEGLPVSVLECQSIGCPALLSDRISKECAINSNVKFLPIDRGFSNWADAILKRELQRVSLEESYKNLSEAGFNVELTSQWLTSFYMDILKK